MRIWLLSEHADPLEPQGGADAGGQNVHVAALAAGLVRRGHTVTVFTRLADAGSARRESAEGYTLERVPAGPVTRLDKDELLPHMPEWGDRLHARRRRDEEGGRGPDVVHAHFWMSGIAGLRAVLGSSVPLVQTFHALGSVKRREQLTADTSPDTRVALERRLCRAVDGVIATCRDEVRELGLLGLPAGRVDVVPCGVDTGLFRPAPPRADDAAPRLLALGRLVPRKGVDDVVRALADVRTAGVRLTVAGGPQTCATTDPVADAEVARLREVARRHGVADRVRFVGAVPRSDVPALLRAHDAVVTAPWYEPFGIVPLEAMAAGRPVVGTAVGGLLDTVAPEVGVLVPPRSPQALAAAIDRALAEPLRSSAFRAGPRLVRAHYTWDTVAAATEDVYRRVVDRSAPSAAATDSPAPIRQPPHRANEEVAR